MVWNRESTLKSLYRLKERVRKLLGGQCVECGSRCDLHVHHIFGREWDLRKCNRWTRWARYFREAGLGLVELLCEQCNKENGKP